MRTLLLLSLLAAACTRAPLDGASVTAVDWQWLCASGPRSSVSVAPFPGARLQLDIEQTEECGLGECHPAVDDISIVTTASLRLLEPGRRPCAAEVMPRAGAFCLQYAVEESSTPRQVLTAPPCAREDL